MVGYNSHIFGTFIGVGECEILYIQQNLHLIKS
jgi:hypothetical protein